MKKIILIAAMLITSSIAFADVVRFECRADDMDGVHKFTANGYLVVDDFGKVDGVVNVQTQKACEEQSVQVFEQLSAKGFIKHYEPTKASENDYSYDQVFLKIENSYLKKMSIALDLKVSLSSNIISIDNFLYRSNCYTIKE